LIGRLKHIAKGVPGKDEERLNDGRDGPIVGENNTRTSVVGSTSVLKVELVSLRVRQIKWGVARVVQVAQPCTTSATLVIGGLTG
jgi:hypothetical protein